MDDRANSPACCGSVPTRPAPSPRPRSDAPRRDRPAPRVAPGVLVTQSAAQASQDADRKRAVDRRIIGARASRRSGRSRSSRGYVLVDTAIVGRLGTEQLAGLAVAAHRAVVRVRRRQLPHLRHDRAGRPPPRCGRSRRRAADVGVQAMWLSVLVGAAGRAPPVRRRPTAVVAARRSRRGARPRHHVPAHQRRRRAVLPGHARRPGRAARRVRLHHTARILFVANVANLVLELVFVFGFDIGVAGSAWSTVIAQIGAALAFLRHPSAAPRGRLRAPTRRGPASARW